MVPLVILIAGGSVCGLFCWILSNFYKEEERRLRLRDLQEKAENARRARNYRETMPELRRFSYAFAVSYREAGSPWSNLAAWPCRQHNGLDPLQQGPQPQPSNHDVRGDEHW